MLYPAAVASDPPLEDPSDAPAEATAHDGDDGLDTAARPEPVAASQPAEDTVRDVIESARDDLTRMLAAIDNDETADVDMDGLLDGAHGALTQLLAGEECPMCKGDGVLAIEPPADPRAERCADCDGLGTVYTGSRVPESATRPCGKCSGAGFVNLADVTPLPGADYTAPLPTTDKLWYDADDAGTWHLPVDPAKRGLTVG